MATTSSNTSEKSSKNEPEIPSASNGARALRYNEAASSILREIENIRKEGPNVGDHGPQLKKKCFHRLTREQSDILESFFITCPHPIEVQRNQLSQLTGLDGNQVKFWFQNKRTHVKHQSDKEENIRLHVKNIMLRHENNVLKKAKESLFCPQCTTDPRQLEILQECKRLKSQNEWMRQELARLISAAPSRAFQFQPSSEPVFVPQDDARKLTEIARDAVRDLVTLASSNGPLWICVPGGSLETLSMMDYARAFAWPGGDMGLNMEATRANAVVMLDCKSIVEAFMVAERYKIFFPGIITGATTDKVFNWPSNGDAGYDGAMVLMSVDVAFPSPFVPVKKCTFLRYCKMLEHGAVAIVDISVVDCEGIFYKCCKKPSGLLIEPFRPNSCKVTAIEHVQVQDTGIHELFKECSSGLLFGARRWVMSMARQCARIRDVTNVSSSSKSGSAMGRSTLEKMADTLLANFVAGITGLPAENWIIRCREGDEDDVVKIVLKRNGDGDGTDTATVCASASFKLPVPMRRAFTLLKNNNLRGRWDALVKGSSIKDEVRVANGVGDDDSISVLHVKLDTAGGKETKMILQNSSYDASGSFLVYASLDKQLMTDMIMNPGGNQDISDIPLFPSGIFLVPVPDAAQPTSAVGDAGEIVVTVGSQIVTKVAPGTEAPELSAPALSSVLKIMSDNIRNVIDTLVNSDPVLSI